MNKNNDYNVWKEYDMIAEHFAKQGKLKVYGEKLPDLSSNEVVSLINYDIESFESRINDFAYAIAMNKHNID